MYWQVDDFTEACYEEAREDEMVLRRGWGVNVTVRQYRKAYPEVARLVALHHTLYGISFFDINRLTLIGYEDAMKRSRGERGKFITTASDGSITVEYAEEKFGKGGI